MPSQQSSSEPESPHSRWVIGDSKRHTPARRALPKTGPKDPGGVAVSPLASRYGLAIRARRRELDWAQWELGDRLGLSRTTIANIERGRSVPTIDHLRRFAESLNMDPLELLRRALEEEKPE